ncbi:MAG: hypothetical protein IJ658_11840 [Kiritimatiellae bacterium]|nr:hypothetical protein [Kiritimatiellia bacterium]
MKLRKTGSDEQTAAVAPTGGAVIADRFKLDMDPNAGKPDGVGKTSALIALLGSLAAIAMLGVVAGLMYMNWDMVKDL